MKLATVSKSLVAGLALFLASSAFAATTGHMELQNPTLVNGTQLKAGDYKLEWDGTGPDVEVSVMQGKKVVAKVPAKVVELKTKAQSNSAIVSNNTDGTSSLAGVHFAGKTTALELPQTGGGMESGSK
jgi:hypothetical protein